MNTCLRLSFLFCFFCCCLKFDDHMTLWLTPFVDERLNMLMSLQETAAAFIVSCVCPFLVTDLKLQLDDSVFTELKVRNILFVRLRQNISVCVSEIKNQAQLLLLSFCEI